MHQRRVGYLPITIYPWLENWCGSSTIRKSLTVSVHVFWFPCFFWHSGHCTVLYESRKVNLTRFLPFSRYRPVRYYRLSDNPPFSPTLIIIVQNSVSKFQKFDFYVYLLFIYLSFFFLVIYLYFFLLNVIWFVNPYLNIQYLSLNKKQTN